MEHVVTRKAAKILGVHPNTLRKWAKEGKIKYIKSASGQRRYNVDDYLGKNTKAETICYCRVSSYKQKDDFDCNEAYTSKTHPQTGQIKNIGSAKWIKLLDGSKVSRDVVGARNILIRALVDPPTGFSCAVNFC